MGTSLITISTARTGPAVKPGIPENIIERLGKIERRRGLGKWRRRRFGLCTTVIHGHANIGGGLGPQKSNSRRKPDQSPKTEKNKFKTPPLTLGKDFFYFQFYPPFLSSVIYQSDRENRFSNRGCLPVLVDVINPEFRSQYGRCNRTWRGERFNIALKLAAAQVGKVSASLNVELGGMNLG